MDLRPPYFIFVAATLVTGIAIGAVSVPGAWYEALEKPVFNPPDWVFAPAWTLLYILIGLAGARVWRYGPQLARRFWFAQMAFNFLWSPLFFVAHRPDLSLGVLALMLVAIIGFIVATWRSERVSTLLFMPYAAWVIFAGSLNWALLILN